MIRPLAALLFLVACCAASAAQPPHVPCDYAWPGCPPVSYPFVADKCKPPRCDNNNVPPPAPAVYCTYMGGGYDCAVWPRGPEMHYTYAASGPVQISDAGPTYQSNVWVQCPTPGRPGGVLSVTAHSPYGLASPDKTIALSCRDQQEH